MHGCCMIQFLTGCVDMGERQGYSTLLLLKLLVWLVNRHYTRWKIQIRMPVT